MVESIDAEKAMSENNFKIFDEPFESSEEEWNPTDCSEDEFDTETLVIHKRKRKNCVTQQLKFNCPVENCEAVYRKKWLLDDHIRKHNKERPFHCTSEECNKSFTKEAHLKRHKILVHEKSCELACDVKGCGLIYNNKYSLKKHKNQVHNSLKWPFFCNECFIGFKKKWQLNQHNYKHTGEPPFKCTLCNIGFTVQRDLTKHNRNHKTYKCNCGEVFERWSHLNLHKKKCSAKEDFICNLCNKIFSKKENLNAHQSFVHQESIETKLYHCPYLNCTRSYKYKKNVNFHISFFHEKSNQKEIPCPTCGKIFHMQVYLNRHIEKMHNSPKISKPRAIRKDKNKSRTCTAAVLAGLKLSQKEHLELLKNPNKQLNIRLSRVDFGEIESKLNKSNGDSEETENIELIEDLASIEQTNKKDDIGRSNSERKKTEDLSGDKIVIIEDNCTNCDKISDLEDNIQQKNVNDKILNTINDQSVEESGNEILENEEQIIQEHLVNINTPICLTDILNKHNKSNHEKQTDINELTEIVPLEAIIEKKEDNVILKTTERLLVEDNFILSEIIDLEQNIQLNNLNYEISNQILEAPVNWIVENKVQTSEGHTMTTNISRIDVPEIENKVAKPIDEEFVLLNSRKTLPEHSNVNYNTIIDLGQIILPKNVNDTINIETLETTINSVIENEVQIKQNIKETENKVDIFNGDIAKSKEIVSIEQTHKKEDPLILNLRNTETLPVDIVNYDVILDLGQITRPNNVNDSINDEIFEASVNEVIENEVQTKEGHKKDITEVENELDKINDLEQSKEVALTDQPNKKDSLIIEDLDQSSDSSEEEWNPTDHSEDEFKMDVSPLMTKQKKRNYKTQKLKFRCPLENCESAYRKKWLLEDHILKHNKERPFRCTIEECNKSFTKEAHLKRHKILVHEKSGELTCDVKGCGLIYNNKYSLKKHKNQVHNALKWPFFCNECCIGFKKRWQLNQHNYKHTGEPPFKCTLCNIGFTIQRDLTKHNRNHKTYSCHCGQIFERWSHLGLHKKKCSTKEEFICNLCDRRFSKKENLTAHRAFIHEEPKESEVYHCPYLNCTRSYKYKKNMNFHISLFHEKNKQREIPCPTCGKIFHMQIYLNRHLEKMHKLPKISKSRATRKDKNKKRTYTAAVLAGLKLSQKEHINLLNNSKKQLIIRISRIDFNENETKVSKSNDNLQQSGSNELKGTALTEQTNKKDGAVLHLEKMVNLSEDNIMKEDNSKNCITLTDLEQNIQRKNVNDINIELSVNEILQNGIQAVHQHQSYTTAEEINISTFSDDVIVACNSVLNIIEECVA